MKNNIKVILSLFFIISCSYADIIQVATIENKKRVKHIYSNLDRLFIPKEHIY